MFIQTEATPNPATLKFLPGKVVMETGTAEFRDATSASASPLAARIFAIPGVTGVFFGYDFVTVSKDGPEWHHLKPAILGTIMEHFMSGAPVMGTASTSAQNDSDEEFFDAGDETIVATIKELLETRVRPAVAQDGGDITFRGFKDGKVFLNMKGSCAGCPSSTATLKHGVQNLLRHFVPEVQEVEAV
ncbi:MAG: NifU family protein [Alphaproteobacteria bacterium]|jgi:Fe-S cluster biogenesis protein NfuA|uniref:NifU family protein n=1 Tax=Rhizobium/Agrobacterium group TaxID=227290 RepID=UPI0006B963D9|nr:MULTISPECIES: NifU family protein [Rhizobium/Agrobacterium group]MBU0739639.1 NifU family protein [Alphaproteobacteria bacterium]MDM7982434.1 NifU family protein [Rhizobium sp.]AOG08705.1 nifU-like domain protein [Agrobacterium sp. RAC06]KPF59415.1 iron transporter [Rhizobium sp. AAP116]MBU0832561.1 NifU family protein [Alphaproteobacteria bacterium]